MRARAYPHQAQQSLKLPLLALSQKGLMRIITFLLFMVSGGVLYRLFGYNYTGQEGSFFTKVHPATYLSFIYLVLLWQSPQRHFHSMMEFVYFYRLPLSLIAADALYAFFIIAADRRSMASTVDTYLYPALLAIMLTQLDEKLRVSLQNIIHIAFAVNALLALFEMITGARVFPFVIDGKDYEWDTRSTALMGHPLGNATLTGTYVISLLFGGAKQLHFILRAFIICLQFAALGAFGGRTAFVLVLLCISIFVFWRGLGFIRGDKLPLQVIAFFLIGAPIIIGLFTGLIFSGAFDKVLNRFSEDGGSANARIIMLQLFDYVSLRELILGADLGLIKSLQATHGIEMGIENPIIRNILTQGALMTIIVFGGVAALLVFVIRTIGMGGILPLCFYVILIMSYESISGKTIILAQYIGMQLILFQPKALN